MQLVEGNKIIEIRNTWVNKGTAATEWMGAYPPEFILGIGDDQTDEDLFRALPPSAWSLRVGVANTVARYHVSSQSAVRKLLLDLIRAPRLIGDPQVIGGLAGPETFESSVLAMAKASA